MIRNWAVSVPELNTSKLRVNNIYRETIPNFIEKISWTTKRIIQLSYDSLQSFLLTIKSFLNSSYPWSSSRESVRPVCHIYNDNNYPRNMEFVTSIQLPIHIQINVLFVGTLSFKGTSYLLKELQSFRDKNIFHVELETNGFSVQWCCISCKRLAVKKIWNDATIIKSEIWGRDLPIFQNIIPRNKTETEVCSREPFIKSALCWMFHPIFESICKQQ
jgi:hypothetical protein